MRAYSKYCIAGGQFRKRIIVEWIMHVAFARFNLDYRHLSIPTRLEVLANWGVIGHRCLFFLCEMYICA